MFKKASAPGDFRISRALFHNIELFKFRLEGGTPPVYNRDPRWIDRWGHLLGLSAGGANMDQIGESYSIAAQEFGLPEAGVIVSPARLAANRRNASLSTGPRSARGRAASSRNALRHGLRSQAPLVEGEFPDDFSEFRTALLEALDPAGLYEAMLVERIVDFEWRLRRVSRLEKSAIERRYRLRDSLGDLNRVCTYEAHILRHLRIAYNDLQNLQAIRFEEFDR